MNPIPQIKNPGPNNQLQLTGDATFTYTYDPNGNLVQRVARATGARTTYIWDTEHQLIRVDFPGGRATYLYDGLGRRITKTVGTQVTRYVYDGPDILLSPRGGTRRARRSRSRTTRSTACCAARE